MIFVDNKILVENFKTDTKSPQRDDMDILYEELMTGLQENFTIPKDVLTSFKIKNELSPDIWNEDRLKPEIRKQLLTIANDFFDAIEIDKKPKVKDILLMGSLANYNWSKFSDIDLHIVVDFKEVGDDLSLVTDYFWAQKDLWNSKHDIEISGYPIELYVQDTKDKTNSSGIYSIQYNRWVTQPDKEKFKLNKEVLTDKANQFYDQIKTIKKNYQSQAYQKVVDAITKLKEKIRKMRQSGLEKGGEFSIENLTFKVLRRTSFMELLDTMKNNAYDKLMSLSDAETITENKTHPMFKGLIQEKIKSLITEALGDNADRHATTADYLRAKYRTAILTQRYKHDDYFMKEDTGDFIAAAIVDIRGNVKISQVAKVPAGDLRTNRLGIVRDTKDYLQFYVMVGRGGEHPDTEKERNYDAATRNGLASPQSPNLPTETINVHLDNPINMDGQTIENINVVVVKPGSPASDAQIKTFLLYGPEIIDFVEKNMKNSIGYQDGKGSEIRNGMMAKKKIEIIRKDAEDAILRERLPRVALYATWEEFRTQFIDSLPEDQKENIDTKMFTQKFIEYYKQKIGDKSQERTNFSLDTKTAGDVEARQNDAAARKAAFDAKKAARAAGK